MEREVGLDTMHGRKVVVLYFAQLEKATGASCQSLFYAQLGKTAGSGMHMPWSAARAHKARMGIGQNSLLTAFGRVVDQQIDSYVTE